MPTPYTAFRDTDLSAQGAEAPVPDGIHRRCSRAVRRELRDILAVLNTGQLPDDAIGLAGFGTHPLTGERRGTWSIVVTRNWRVTFRVVENDAVDVDFEDYH